MNDQVWSFEECIEMIRSDDPETYEQGFWSLLERVPRHTDVLIQLMQTEQKAFTRATFVELLGATKSRKVVPVLAAELEHSEREVRDWAVLGLEELGFPEAQELAANYKTTHPEEWGS
jgi:HEAT repeat protein